MDRVGRLCGAMLSASDGVLDRVLVYVGILRSCRLLNAMRHGFGMVESW